MSTRAPSPSTSACFDQDQRLDQVDFANLRARLGQNSVLEKISNLWLDRLLAKAPDLKRA